MDDRGCLAVKVGQTSGHVAQDGPLHSEGDVSGVLQQVVETERHGLHHQDRKL